MSVRALTWSFNLELRDVTAKAVLHALADHADEEGRCWPSLDRIARFAGCGERTAQRAIQRVVDLGIVSRETRSGRTDIFSLNFDWNPRQSDTPVKSTPVSLNTRPPSERHPTPVNLTPHPRQSDTRTVKEPSLNPQGNRQGARAPKKPKAPLPEDWQPDDRCRAYARERDLDAEVVRKAFVDYFANGRGSKEKRAEWRLSWEVWCDRDARRAGKSWQAGESWRDRQVREAHEAIDRELAK